MPGATAYDRLREEVDSVTGGRPVTAQVLPELGYAARVFKEALRLYPPAAIMVRSAARDSRIGPYRVKRGSLVILAPWVVHRRPDLYPEPDRFEPDRFLPAAARKIPKCGYLPFGAGERVCIGNHLALMEGQLLTATFAREVEMTLDRQPPVKPVLRINVRPEPGIWVRVRRRRG